MGNTTNTPSYFTATGPIDVDALMAFHRERYAGWSMELEEEQPAEEDKGQEPEADKQGEEPDPEEQADKDEQDDDEDDKAEKPKLSHEDALSALADVRRSEANTRTRLREVEALLEAAKTPEQVEEIITKIQTDNATEAHSLLVENVALSFKLPKDLSEALKGETRAELEAHAKVLAKYAPVNNDDPDLSGGLDPSDNEDAFDPVKAARQARGRRY